MRTCQFIGKWGEKPLKPDSVERRAIGTPVANGRIGNWTVTPFFNAHNNCCFVPSSCAEKESQSLSSLTWSFLMDEWRWQQLSATVKGSTDDVTFFNTLAMEGGLIDEMKKSGLCKANPGIIILYGHSSRLSGKLAPFLASHSVYCTIMPSHTSTVSGKGWLGKMKEWI